MNDEHMKDQETKDQYERCQRVRVTGEQCGSPALKGDILCYWHRKAENRFYFRELNGLPQSERPVRAIALPPLEDANSIQIAIDEIVHAIISNRLDPKRAGLTLYALQLALANVRHLKPIAISDAVVAIEDPTSVLTDIIKQPEKSLES